MFFFEVLAALDDRFDSVAIIAHNPGITNFATQLAPDAELNNMPTCAVFAVKADVERWSAFGKAKREFLFFDYPKNV